MKQFINNDSPIIVPSNTYIEREKIFEEQSGEIPGGV